jgi:hypothetical protein
MDEQELAGMKRERARKFYTGLALMGLGVTAVVAGGVFARGETGDAASGPGFAVGLGVALGLGGAIMAWAARPWNRRWISEAPQTKRERLQGRRSLQLFLFPGVALIFTALAIEPANNIVAGEGGLRDGLSVLLPVLYAWLTTAIAMGWDGPSRRNRRFLEDELTVAIRARAMSAAFLVLLAGTTAALGLTLVRPDLGVVALLFTLAAAGATAGVRFAWLDREAGQDG